MGRVGGPAGLCGARCRVLGLPGRVYLLRGSIWTAETRMDSRDSFRGRSRVRRLVGQPSDPPHACVSVGSCVCGKRARTRDLGLLPCAGGGGTGAAHAQEHLMVHRMLLVLDRNHPPAPSSSICGLCDAKFGFFIPRHGVCRSCRQVVCKPCSQVWRSGDTVDGTIMLCLACADTLLDDDRPRGGPVVASGSPPIMGRTTQQQERQDRTETRSREGTFTFLSSTRSMRHTVLEYVHPTCICTWIEELIHPSCVCSTCAIEDVTAMTKDWKAVGAATKRSCHGTDAAVDRPCQAARAIDPRDLNDALDDVVRFMVALQRGGDFPDNERATTG
ncbi:hypothetical protein, variant 3 [Aphanomyces astaci]|uniref:FYVE-type domain-containing protein n=1 Tax=Aphanomyces astaci TaxID=112090 RepID=W4FJM2_APHAT|nr:hypothetical protein, variant 2 [Aphanomyces astaci]XP_009843583.1 hypothetical protein, variant 3 [Aphanomyces astaci]ETV66942.1 hypothetical protein, variant 2 [Aphanomyces astaci]ETV66943.1 hypothetical protein, variant 3 [Aphanomyces astaci]|eukprot:XP_009843581.1 hypothetical protein, variant 2 [Aphanomyces astaci]